MEFALTLSQHCLLAGRVIWFYLGKFIWPANLTFTYPRWIIDPHQWWQYLFPAGVLIAAVGLLLAARKHRGPLASFLICIGTLFPALGFLNVYPFRYSYVADHFQYLAGLAIIVPAAVGLTWIGLRALPKSANLPFAAGLVAVLAVLTWRQCHMYRDAETLYRETIARNPSAWLPRNNLGHLLARAPERLPEAIAEYETALRINPEVPEPHVSLGSAFAQMPGQVPEAVAEYQAALRMKPDYTEAHLALGNSLAHLPGRLEDAVPEYQAALRLQPDLPVARLNLGNALRQIPGRLPDAIAEYKAALLLWPEFAEAHYNLGSALAQIPVRTNEAVAEFQAALRCKPDFEAARRAIQYLQTNPQ